MVSLIFSSMKKIQMVDLGGQYQGIKDQINQSIETILETSAFINGPDVHAFSRELEDYLGVKHAVATNSGTAALHVALLTAGVQPEDEVLTSTLTFIAPANSIRYVGAWPVFIDSEPDYWQLDPERVIDLDDRPLLFASLLLHAAQQPTCFPAICPSGLLSVKT